MNHSEITLELSQYIGTPKCQDCKWKLDTDITNNCGCRGKITLDKELKYEAAIKRVQELQALLAAEGKCL